MRILSLKVPKDLEARLEKTARARQTTKSHVIREALEAYLVKDRGSRQPTILEVAGDLAGCLEGPGDLSYNKKYMRDFGK